MKFNKSTNNRSSAKVAESNASVSKLGASRRSFLKKTVAFAALTASYSVVSLTQLACSSDDVPTAYTQPNGDYFGSGNTFYY